ncbi:lyase [Bosea sp. CS1GBMeth4]|uniref:lyase n=1 Tax=Bosea sp. CS1GBMeth4 TaxID=1892849 RepID=UPI0016478F92|nr:lyase [Bosea sp. CS1GBMeth4]
MSELYQPASDFLIMVANGEVPLTGSEFADANLHMLLYYTRDSDLSNRDWATFLLAHADVDRAEVTVALHRCLEDESENVQEEAMVGLARRHDLTALPRLHGWLRQGALSRMILEAAAEFGESSICQSLESVEQLANELGLRFLWEEACEKCGCPRKSA